MFCCPFSLHFTNDSSHGKRFHTLFVRNSIPKCFTHIYFWTGVWCSIEKNTSMKCEKSVQKLHGSEAWWWNWSANVIMHKAYYCFHSLLLDLLFARATSSSGRFRPTRRSPLTSSPSTSRPYENCCQGNPKSSSSSSLSLSSSPLPLLSSPPPSMPLPPLQSTPP